MGIINKQLTDKSGLWHSSTNRKEMDQIRNKLKINGAKTRINKDRCGVYGLWVDRDFYDKHSTSK